MGTKRVGLARVEALMEGLKRDLDLQTSSLIGGTSNQSDGTAFATGGTHPDLRLRYHLEEVSLVGVTPNDQDNAIIAYLSKKFDGTAIIQHVFAYASEVFGSASGGDLCVNLQLSATGDTAAGTAVVSGTEILGSAAGTPLHMDSDDTAGVPVAHNPCVVSGAKVHVAICEDNAQASTNEAMTAGRVVVGIIYFGKAMVAA